MTRPRRIAAVVIAAALATGIGTLSAVAATGPGAPAPLQPPFVASDASTRLTLTVQIQPGVRSTGEFDFSVANVGDWVGVIPVHPAGSRIVRLEGTATGVAFQAAGTSASAPAAVRMDGSVDKRDQAAVVALVVTRPGHRGWEHYLLVTPRPRVEQAPGAAYRAALAIQYEDWHAVYRMAASTITRQYTEAQFVTAMDAQQAQSMHKIRLAGKGTASIVSGVHYFAQPIRFTATGPDGKTTTYTANVTLVWEQGRPFGIQAWRFLGTTAPSS